MAKAIATTQAAPTPISHSAVRVPSGDVSGDRARTADANTTAAPASPSSIPRFLIVPSAAPAMPRRDESTLLMTALAFGAWNNPAPTPASKKSMKTIHTGVAA